MRQSDTRDSGGLRQEASGDDGELVDNISLFRELFESAAVHFSDRTFVHCQGKGYTYREVNELAERAAAGFQNAIGLRSGATVALLLPETLFRIVAFLGLQKIGARVVNLDPAYPQRVLSDLVEDSQTTLIVTIPGPSHHARAVQLLGRTLLRHVIINDRPDASPGKQESSGLFSFLRPGRKSDAGVDWSNPQVRKWRDVDGMPGEAFVRHWTAVPDAEAVMLHYSGGVTGERKACALSHKHILAAATAVGDLCEMLHPDDAGRFLSLIPLTKLPAFSIAVLGAIVQGGTLFLLPEFDPERVCDMIAGERITVLTGTPPLYEAVLRAGAKRRKNPFASLRTCLVTGGICLPATRAMARELLPVRLLETWETSEATGMGTCMDPGGPEGSCGRAVTGLHLAIIDPSGGMLLPAGERGEILVSGDSLCDGYWKKSRETARYFRDGWFATGDYGYLDNNGYLFVTGSRRDTVLVGHRHVYMRDIEDAASAHPNVSDAAAVHFHDPKRGEITKLFVSLHNASDSMTIEKINDFLCEDLGEHELPAELEVRSQLPRDVSGNIDRDRLLQEEKLKRRR